MALFAVIMTAFSSVPALAEQQQPRDNAQNPPAQTVVVTQANAYSGVVDVDYGDGMGSNAGTKSREEEIRESVRRSGGTLELGMGYGFLANLNIHVDGQGPAVSYEHNGTAYLLRQLQQSG